MIRHGKLALMGKRVYWVSPQEDPSYITEPEDDEIAVAIRVARKIYQAAKRGEDLNGRRGDE